MAIIDPDGLFNGERLRRCSNAARLHWPYLYAASNGFGRLELDYKRILGKAFFTFEPWPTEAEIVGHLDEFVRNFLLFVWQPNGGRWWGQWDTNSSYLPRYKTAGDRASPEPPSEIFKMWRKAISSTASTRLGVEFAPVFGKGDQLFQSLGLPKYFGNFAETFHAGALGVGVGVGKDICASPKNGHARVGGSLPSIDNPPFSTLEPDHPAKNGNGVNGQTAPAATGSLFADSAKAQVSRRLTLAGQQKTWFRAFWAEYWRLVAKKSAEKAFSKHVTTEDEFQRAMKRLRAQRAEMLGRDVSKRPYPASWLNAEDFDDEQESTQPADRSSDDYPEFRT